MDSTNAPASAQALSESTSSSSTTVDSPNVKSSHANSTSIFAASQPARSFTASEADPVPVPAPTPKPARAYRVLMIAPTSFFADYGCHVRIVEEARVLQKLGHHVTIATYYNGGDVPDVTIRRTLPIPWRRDYEVGSSRHKIAFDALLGAKTLQLMAGGRYDVIHAHLHEGALIAHVLGALFRVPVVFDFQGSLTEEMIDHTFLERENVLYGPLRRLEQWIDRKSKVIFTSSSHAERLLLEDFQCAPEQVRVLPDCVNPDVFRPAQDFPSEERLALRRELGIPDGHRVIVYLGLLAEYQGTGLLLQALQRILAARHDVYLLLMGFPGVSTYRARAAELGVAHAVTFTGRIPYQEAPRYLALGDVAAAPKLSTSESAGKLLNYMAAGLPTVAFDTPVAREYLGADGLLAAAGDVESLAGKLQAALDPDEATAMQKTGMRLRRRAQEYFDWEQAGQMIVATYDALLQPSTGQSQANSMRTTR